MQSARKKQHSKVKDSKKKQKNKKTRESTGELPKVKLMTLWHQRPKAINNLEPNWIWKGEITQTTGVFLDKRYIKEHNKRFFITIFHRLDDEV